MATALLVVAVALLAMPAQAADNTKLAELKTSLNSVPDDVSLYLGMFRAGEQVKMIGNSRAWEKLTQSPAVQLAWAMYQMQSSNPDTPAGKVAMAMEDAQVQDVLALLGDMFDDEAFAYADQSLVDSIRLMQKVQRLGQMNGFESGKANAEIQKKMAKLADASDEEREEIFEEMQKLQQKQSKKAFELLASNLDAIKVPTIVFGSKLDDTDRAEVNLGKLEFILGMGLMQAASQQPNLDLREVLKREKIDDANFLVIKLSGKMIPWEEDNPLSNMAEEDENAAKLIEKIKNENLVIAIGVKGDYLLVSIGSSLEEIKKFGQGTALVSRPEMTKLEPYAGEPITDISYVSKEFMALNTSYQKDVQLAFAHASKQLDKTDLSQSEKDQILSDMKELGKQLKSVLPIPGAISSVSYMTATGQEQYTFSWVVGGPGEQPLELLNHVGGSPILAIVSVCPLDVEFYDAAAHWANVGWGYFEKYGLPNLPEDKKAEVQDAIKLFGPTVMAFHETTREKFLPAFGGEFAIQADTELTLSTIPGVDKEMPMIEPAIILAVKDKDLMDEALVDYWEVLRNALYAAGQKCDEIKKVQLYDPSVVEGDAGKMYVFAIPSKCPVSGEIEPTVGIGEDTLVFAATPKAAERLMKKTPLAYGGVLADPAKPRISAGCFAWKDLLTAGKPWVMFGIEKALEEAKDNCPLPPDAIRSQAQTILDILSVIQDITVEKYRQDDVIVIHSQTTIKDVD